MLDVEPPAGLRGRVIARIDNPTSVASGFSRKIFWVGAPLAAAAAIVILALLIPREQTQHSPSAPVAVATVQPPSTRGTEPTPEAGSRKPEAGSRELKAGSRALRKPRPTQTRSADRIVAAATTSVDGATIEIEPLRRIVPIEFAPLTQDSIAPAPIEFRPLSTITEVPIAPLSLPERRH